MRYLPAATSGTRVAGSGIKGMNTTSLYFVWGFYLDLFTNSLLIGNAFGKNVVRWRLGVDH